MRFDIISKLHKGFYLVFTAFFLCTQFSCKKLVDVPAPITSTNGANAYTNDATATSVLTGIYAKMSSSTSFANGNSSVSLFCGLSADELTLFSGVAATDNKPFYYTNALNAIGVNTSPGTQLWDAFYSYLYTCNAVISGLTDSTANSLTPSVRQQLLGEAKFMRGLIFFYLTNLYGDIPLPLTTRYDDNTLLPRVNQTLVYQQIIVDLKDAQQSLSPDFLDGTLQKLTGTPDRLRPSKWAATALLARVYLYMKDYAHAEAQADDILNNTSLFGLSTLNNSFLKASSGNKEAIWQLQPTVTGHNTEDGWFYVLPSAGPNSGSNPVYLSSALLNSFETGDQRRVIGNWINSLTVGATVYYYPNKYKSATLNASVTEHQMVLRVGEQYLIRAEARAMQNKTSGAQSDLNMIRNRAGLANTTASDQPTLLAAIAKERRVELFCEWGDRWLNLKRTGTVDAVMSVACPAKGGTWNSYQQLYPILLHDIMNNPNLTQNAGY